MIFAVAGKGEIRNAQETYLNLYIYRLCCLRSFDVLPYELQNIPYIVTLYMKARYDMTCKECLHKEVCPKAEHVENYHMESGCSDFKDKAGDCIDRQKLLERARKHQNNPFGIPLIIAEIENCEPYYKC